MSEEMSDERLAHAEKVAQEFANMDRGLVAKLIQARALAWISGQDTGLSSKTIWRQMMKVPHSESWHGVSHPHDFGDFGRCDRLLRLIPEWRNRFFEEMGGLSPTWQRLVERWEDLERMYDKGEKWPSDIEVRP